MGRKALSIVLLLVMVTGIFTVMVPVYLDRAAQWEMFVGRLGYFIPGVIMATAGLIGLTVLDRTK